MPPEWFCIQLGAREHYAIPRALHQQCALAGLATEAWVRPDGVFGMLPARFAGRIKERFHPELASARVASFTAGWLLFETRHRRRLRGWELTIARNRWFQRRVVSVLAKVESRLQSSLPPEKRVLFAYSYAALEPFRWAKARGWTTVLGQIDPGPVEAEIVTAEQSRYLSLASRWQTPPADYWATWRQECDLADVIVANSEWSRAGLSSRGVHEEKIEVVPLIYENLGSAVGPKQYPESFSKARPLRVLFLGQVNLRKGVARLLEAARELAGEPIAWWLVGPCDFEPSQADRSASHLRWIGSVRRSEVARYYEEADVFIFPTLSDGFGLTQLEAQARRLPLVASGNCGAVVRDGENGFRLPEVSREAISTVLLECVRNPRKLAAMSARSQVAGDYSPVCIAAKLSKLAERACSKKAPSCAVAVAK